MPKALQLGARIRDVGFDLRSFRCLQTSGGEPGFKQLEHFLRGPVLVTYPTLLDEYRPDVHDDRKFKISWGNAERLKKFLGPADRI